MIFLYVMCISRRVNDEIKRPNWQTKVLSHLDQSYNPIMKKENVLLYMFWVEACPVIFLLWKDLKEIESGNLKGRFKMFVHSECIHLWHVNTVIMWKSCHISTTNWNYRLKFGRIIKWNILVTYLEGIWQKLNIFS